MSDPSVNTVNPALPGVSDLDGWWASLENSLRDRGMLLFPATPMSLRGAVEWPDNRSVDDFLAMAHEVGVRLVYSTPVKLNEEMAAELPADARTHLGQVAMVDVWWAYQGVRHACTVLADWYLPLIEQTMNDRQAARDREEAAIPKMAAALARNPAFSSAPGGAMGRQSVGQAAYPDLSSDILRRVVNEAWTIYSTQVLPELDQATAQKACELMAGGASITETARRIGISRERLGRILATYAQPEPDGSRADGAPRLL